MVPHGRPGDPNIQTNAVVEQLPTPVKSPKPHKSIQPPDSPQSPYTPKVTEVPEVINAPAAMFDIDLNEDEALNMKVDDTKTPLKYI